MVMYNFRDFLSKLRHHFRFSKEEIEACVISVLVMAFIISFDEWGYGNAFDFNIGLMNLFRAIIIVSIVLGVQISVIKLQSLQWGYRAEFKLWWYGIIIGLGLCFLSASFSNSLGGVSILWFLAPGGIFFHHLATHRLGWFRYGLNIMETSVACQMGVLSTMGVAIVFKLLLYAFPGSLFLEKGMIVALWFAVFSILPIPPLHGSKLFFWSRGTYATLLGGVIAFNFLLRTDLSIFLTLLFSFLFGIIISILNFWKVES